MNRTTQKKEIQLCPTCKGLGKAPAVDENGHPLFSKGKPYLELCPLCEGEGRILIVQTTEIIPLTSNIVEEEPKEVEISLKNLFKKRK